MSTSVIYVNGTDADIGDVPAYGQLADAAAADEDITTFLGEDGPVSVIVLNTDDDESVQKAALAQATEVGCNPGAVNGAGEFVDDADAFGNGSHKASLAYPYK